MLPVKTESCPRFILREIPRFLFSDRFSSQESAAEAHQKNVDQKASQTWFQSQASPYLYASIAFSIIPIFSRWTNDSTNMSRMLWSGYRFEYSLNWSSDADPEYRAEYSDVDPVTSYDSIDIVMVSTSRLYVSRGLRIQEYLYLTLMHHFRRFSVRAGRYGQSVVWSWNRWEWFWFRGFWGIRCVWPLNRDYLRTT